MGPLVGGFALALIAVTWRLWTPQDRFPEVPALQLATGFYRGFDWVALAILIVALVAGVMRWTGASRRLSFGICCAMLLYLFLGNQHRLQPWAYQFFWYSLILAFAKREDQVSLMRLLAISIYVFSAISKLDFQFVHTVGQEFAETLFGFVGVDVTPWSDRWRVSLAIAMPVGELIVAILLCIGATRKLGVWMAITLHTVLILILSPLGLNHAPGVILWNLFFIAQAVILFRPDARPNDSELQDGPSEKRTAVQWLTRAIVVGIAIVPILESIDRYDHWLAWGLYAPRSSRARVVVGPTLKESLPAHARKHVDDQGKLHIDRWSIAELGVPIYPHARFQVGVATKLLEYAASGRELGVEILGPAERISGGRQSRWVRADSLPMESQRFYFNASPR